VASAVPLVVDGLGFCDDCRQGLVGEAVEDACGE
jgi:hypothetical protein